MISGKMTREEALSKAINIVSYFEANFAKSKEAREDAVNIIEALEQQLCEMTVEEYRQRMIQAFHNADCNELVAVCVLPTEEDFKFLEWLLKKHYKKEPCGEDKGVLEQLAEEQDSLLATTKAWSDAIKKNGYVN